MGESIRSTAGPNTLIAAGASTLEAARIIGGVFAQEADAHLALELDAAAANAQALAAAEARLATATLVRDVVARRAELAVAATHDEMWNALGRPAHDRTLAIVFPLATKTCSMRIGLRPARMAALATVLANQVHSRLPRRRCAERADEIRALAKELRDAIDEVDDAEASQLQHAEVQVALGKVVHAQLAALKRVLKAKGYSEADIHRVIPTQPRARSRAGGAAPATPWSGAPPEAAASDAATDAASAEAASEAASETASEADSAEAEPEADVADGPPRT